MRGRSGSWWLVVVLAGSGCALLPWARPRYDEASFARKPARSYTLALRDGAPVDTVIGTPGTWRVGANDTLLDIARYAGLGYNEITEANPGVDPWVPPVGREIVLPTAWILPCCTYTGLVLNIPEMRLYAYERLDTTRLVVRTYPVGLGRSDRRTPRGKFTIRDKTIDPGWRIPPAIVQEHIAERGDARTFIAGGDPDNPLGKYRLALSLPPYAIHGTNIPWGVGMQVSHGCARLYPEDIERLFPRVAIGTSVEFTYQAAKVGVRADAVYAEAHPDIYRLTPDPAREALAAARRQRLAGRVNLGGLATTLRASRGVPTRVE